MVWAKLTFTIIQAFCLSGAFNIEISAVILIVNGVDGLESVIDNAWGLPGISSLSIPNRAGDSETWDYILDGISLA